MKSVAIFGAGYVGKATKFAIAEDVEIHWMDPALHVNEITYKEDVAFICVPTNELEKDFGLDYTEVTKTIMLLRSQNFEGLIVIRSTCEPEALEVFQKLYSKLVYWPEFLTEANWEIDAKFPNIVVIGGSTANLAFLFDRVNGEWATDAVWSLTDIQTAALAKLGLNGLLAVKVAYMNVLHNLAEQFGADFEQIKDVIKYDGRNGHSHFDVPGPDGKKGFGGKCLPKDLGALYSIADEEFLRSIYDFNNKQRGK